MSNYIANMATNVFPVNNVILKGTMGCMVAGSFYASLQLTNDRVALVSSIAGTVTLWV